jgi:hypothetical protein
VNWFGRAATLPSTDRTRAMAGDRSPLDGTKSIERPLTEDAQLDSFANPLRRAGSEDGGQRDWDALDNGDDYGQQAESQPEVLGDAQLEEAMLQILRSSPVKSPLSPVGSIEGVFVEIREMAAAARTAELKARPHIDPLARKGTFTKRGQGPLKPYGVAPTRSDEEAHMSTVEVALARHDFGEETHSPSNGVNRRGVRFGGGDAEGSSEQASGVSDGVKEGIASKLAQASVIGSITRVDLGAYAGERLGLELSEAELSQVWAEVSGEAGDGGALEFPAFARWWHETLLRVPVRATKADRETAAMVLQGALPASSKAVTEAVQVELGQGASGLQLALPQFRRALRLHGVFGAAREALLTELPADGLADMGSDRDNNPQLNRDSFAGWRDNSVDEDDPSPADAPDG